MKVMLIHAKKSCMRRDLHHAIIRHSKLLAFLQALDALRLWLRGPASLIMNTRHLAVLISCFASFSNRNGQSFLLLHSFVANIVPSTVFDERDIHRFRINRNNRSLIFLGCQGWCSLKMLFSINTAWVLGFDPLKFLLKSVFVKYGILLLGGAWWALIAFALQVSAQNRTINFFHPVLFDNWPVAHILIHHEFISTFLIWAARLRFVILFYLTVVSNARDRFLFGFLRIVMYLGCDNNITIQAVLTAINPILAQEARIPVLRVFRSSFVILSVVRVLHLQVVFWLNFLAHFI